MSWKLCSLSSFIDAIYRSVFIEKASFRRLKLNQPPPDESNESAQQKLHNWNLLAIVLKNYVANDRYYYRSQLQDGVSLLGGVIGAMHIPEKWFPGCLDYYLNSHNIMHILVVTAVYSMHQVRPHVHVRSAICWPLTSRIILYGLSSLELNRLRYTIFNIDRFI